MVHQQFKVSLDSKAYNAGLARMEAETARSTARTAKEFNKVDQSAARAMGGKQSKRSMIAGGVALQAQDIFVQMQMGAKASTIILQQGTQIASLFGPGGMIVGGIAAASILLWDMAHASEQAAEAAAKEAKERQRAAREVAHTQAIKSITNDVQGAEIAKVRADQGDKAAEALERQYKIEDRLNELRKQRDEGTISGNSASLQAGLFLSRMEAEDRARAKAETRAANEKIAAGVGENILDRADQIRGKGLSRSEQRREDRAQSRAERRAINEAVDAADRRARNRKIGITDTRDPAETGLTAKEKRDAAEAGRLAVEAAKKGDEVKLSDESITKILNGLDKLVLRP